LTVLSGGFGSALSATAFTVVDGRRYPYFIDFTEFTLRRYGVHPVIVVYKRRMYLEKGLERLKAAIKHLKIPGPSTNLEEELLTFYSASLIAYHSGKWVVSRLALAEAERAVMLLARENDHTIAELGRLSGIKSLRYELNLYREPIAIVDGKLFYKTYNYSIEFHDYVKFARRLLGDDSWKPINLAVRKGLVFLDRERVLRVVKEALTIYIENVINDLAKNIPTSLGEDIITEFVSKAREIASISPRTFHRERSVAKGIIIEDAFPPCIADIYAAARRGEHLSHHQRFALATFLLEIGAEVDYIVDIFKSMPDFNEKITRYQVEHLAGMRGSGKKYKTYSCEKMRSLGLCKGDCKTRSPIQAYQKKLKETKAQEHRKRLPTRHDLTQPDNMH